MPPGIAGCIHKLSATERVVHGASMSLTPWLWLNIPNSLACSRRGGLKAALPGADNSRMHCKRNTKQQTPKLQRSSKSQTQNPENRCRDKRGAGRFLSLELLWSLEFGAFC